MGKTDTRHGGNDPGAIGNEIIEKDLNLKISQYMANKLKELGADVYLTRDSDETLTPKERTTKVLQAFGNNKDVIVLSNHINAGGGDGAEVIYALRNNDTLPNLILNELSNEGQNIRGSFQRRLPSDNSKDYYFMLRDTGNTQAIIVEYGFLDSTQDDVNQLKNNWQNYADAVVKALASYLNLEYPVQTDIYTVKAGDSLWGIAKKFNTTVDKLKQLNNLNSNMLSINQKLIINEPNNSYNVKAGDTLYNIANSFNTTVSEIMKINNLTNNLLTIGQKLIIPTSENKNINDNIYKVQAGDTLYNIAIKYNSDIETLKELNKLNSDLLTIGQQLIIPINTYTVKAGDTLYNIAKEYNTTVYKIKQLNNLTSDILSIGQTLKL